MIIFVQMGKGKGENMIDMNEIIANNIAILRKQIDLAASEREKQMERSASQHGYRVSGKDNLLSGGTYTPNPEEEDAYALLADIGVPFGSDGEPLGIGWDD